MRSLGAALELVGNPFVLQKLGLVLKACVQRGGGSKGLIFSDVPFFGSQIWNQGIRFAARLTQGLRMLLNVPWCWEKWSEESWAHTGWPFRCIHWIVGIGRDFKRCNTHTHTHAHTQTHTFLLSLRLIREEKEHVHELQL